MDRKPSWGLLAALVIGSAGALLGLPRLELPVIWEQVILMVALACLALLIVFWIRANELALLSESLERDDLYRETVHDRARRRGDAARPQMRVLPGRREEREDVLQEVGR